MAQDQMVHFALVLIISMGVCIFLTIISVLAWVTQHDSLDSFFGCGLLRSALCTSIVCLSIMAYVEVDLLHRISLLHKNSISESYRKTLDLAEIIQIGYVDISESNDMVLDWEN